MYAGGGLMIATVTNYCNVDKIKFPLVVYHRLDNTNTGTINGSFKIWTTLTDTLTNFSHLLCISVKDFRKIFPSLLNSLFYWLVFLEMILFKLFPGSYCYRLFFFLSSDLSTRGCTEMEAGRREGM